ncbi:MAG: MobC family plasmid mobilization relaxosome protein [Hyphomicrobiaceae bacterium]
MPSKGYRKGVSDEKTPHPRQVYFRVDLDAYDALDAEAGERSVTLSCLLRHVVEAHIGRQRTGLPHRRANAAALRELARIGNNLNQVAHQANVMNLHLIEAEARQALAAVMDAVKRL